MENKTSSIIVLVAIIFLGYLFFSNGNTKETSFAKREKCANYRGKAQTQLNESYKTATPYFYDIFYSSKTDSCLYTYGLVLSGVSPEEIGSFVIADYFLGETIFSVGYDNGSGNEESYSYTKRPIFSKEVEKYKN